ncbi:MAG: SufD family Fe-S cluster assembly protein [Fibrobacter sp.]|uniref:SufD family Fe-S cluster assembly protein n=1 Tax=Fibrobacter sp. TaxID=35828 RepID=UPI001B1090E1|nr:SufD family Fe-S cluster assembly protein [Fibrobacter sp.]MBO7059925.1 SufD family Fe-S cluster assembly protein [Fibrobacter sp.]
MDAVTRIQQIGMPRRNNELWTFFPVAKIPAQEYAGTGTATEAAASLPDFEKLIANETDFAALLPLAKNARTMVRTIPEGANEMAMLKCNDDFGHTVLDIGKGAHVSLEILDNKVQHEIVAERFDISVGEDADVEIFFANPASTLPLRFRHFRITQAANSMVRFSNILTDSGIGRISMDCDLNGEGATFDYRSLSILDNTASMHQRLTIRHNAPNTVSTQLARNLLSGSAYASYDGMVIVGEKCTKVNSGQLVNTILLSENASVSVKPVLKIYHDDVECTHGNTVGELDAEQMFYLVSRGIPKETAKKMLMASFAKETFYPLPETPAKKRLLQTLSV